jgi:hypothetical protein
MTSTISLSAQQHAAGKPIRLRGTVSLDNDGWSNWDHAGLGTTTSSSAPANEAAFAHSVHSPFGSAAFNARWRHLGTANYPLGASEGGFTDSATAHFDDSRALDSNFAAGKYLWAYVAQSDGSFVALSSSYHIT